MTAEEYERLLDMYDVSFKNFAEGEVVRGIVLQVSESEVIVDVGYKSEGIIPLDEFRDETGKISDQGRRHRSTCSSRRPRTRKATSSSPRKKPRR